MIDQEFDAGLYAVIPASVLYDTELRPNAKLVYGVISTLARKCGYCWASNAVIGEPLGLAKRTMEDIIRQLRDRGHIIVQVELDPVTKEIKQRRLWISGGPGMGHPPTTEIGGTYHLKRGYPTAKNGVSYKDDNTSIYPPIVPHGDNGACDGDLGKSVPKWNPGAFEKFWQIYRTRCRGENRKGACRAWDKLKPTPELLVRIYTALGQQLASEAWKRGIGIPYCSTYLNGRRWEDVEDDSQPGGDDDQPGEEAQDGWQ